MSKPALSLSNGEWVAYSVGGRWSLVLKLLADQWCNEMNAKRVMMKKPTKLKEIYDKAPKKPNKPVKKPDKSRPSTVRG